MRLDRRSFLRAGAAGLASVALAPRLVFANTATATDLLVVVFLRGGLDGLNAVVPYADPDYARLRPTIGVARPGSATNAALDLDGFYGLHPSLAPIEPLYRAGRLALVHATGFVQNSRSHFTCQDGFERAADASLGLSTGWLGRYVETLGAGASFQAVGIGRAVQPSLRGPVPALGLRAIDEYALDAPEARAPQTESLFASLHTRPGLTERVGVQALGSIDELERANPSQYAPANGASYPNTTFGNQMRELAQLSKAGLGLRVACCDIGGWDTHAREAQDLPPLLDELARTLLAFDTDLGTAMARTSVVVMTEFGRRAAENASGGTDHGTGQAMMLLGGGVLGRRVYADWPGLSNGALADGDLAVRTDYRTVLSELLEKRMGGPDLAHVFPGFRSPGAIGAFLS